MNSHQRKNGQQEQGILCSRTISIEALSLIIETSTEEAHSSVARAAEAATDLRCLSWLKASDWKAIDLIQNKKRKLYTYILHGTSIFVNALLENQEADQGVTTPQLTQQFGERLCTVSSYFQCFSAE